MIQHFKGRNEFARAEHSKCAYQHTRIISGRLHGFSEALIQLGELSVDTIDVLSDKKYLIKEDTYRKDSEYRFAFESRVLRIIGSRAMSASVMMRVRLALTSALTTT